MLVKVNHIMLVEGEALTTLSDCAVYAQLCNCTKIIQFSGQIERNIGKSAQNFVVFLPARKMRSPSSSFYCQILRKEVMPVCDHK